MGGGVILGDHGHGGGLSLTSDHRGRSSGHKRGSFSVTMTMDIIWDGNLGSMDIEGPQLGWTWQWWGTSGVTMARLPYFNWLKWPKMAIWPLGSNLASFPVWPLRSI